MNNQVDRAIIIGLIIAVVFTALAHGAVEPWSVGIFRLMMVALLALWVFRALGSGSLEISLPAAIYPALALLLLGLIQSVSFTDATGRIRTLSQNLEATRMTVTTLFLIVFGGLIAANFLTTRDRLQGLVRTLVIYGSALSLFALVQDFAWAGSFYWMRPLGWEAPSAFGPFVNHNHYAGYLELLIPLPIALIVTGAVRGPERLFCGFAAALMGVSLIFSLSRGGMISLLAQLIFIGAMGLRKSGSRRFADEADQAPEGPGRVTSGLTVFLSRAGAVVAIVIAILVGILWIDAEPVINRVTRGQIIGAPTTPQTETFFSSRGWIWKDTLAMFRDNPVTGVGLGAYPTAYPIYSQSDELNESQAHNDYLQALADGGIIGGAIALWFLIAIFRAISRSCRSRDPLLAGVALGCGGGIVGLLVHSFFDFNLQLPSTSLLFLILTAIVAQLAAGAVEGAGTVQRGSGKVSRIH
jgi:O-antigen ligase